MPSHNAHSSRPCYNSCFVFSSTPLGSVSPAGALGHCGSARLGCECPHKGQSEFCHLGQNSPAAAYSTAFKVQLGKDLLNIKEKKKAHKFLYYRTFFSLLSASYYITIVSCSSMHSFPYTACHFVISYI